MSKPYSNDPLVVWVPDTLRRVALHAQLMRRVDMYRSYAVVWRQNDTEAAHRYELRADALEQGAPLPALQGYYE
jgi:hypothetical protein